LQADLLNVPEKWAGLDTRDIDAAKVREPEYFARKTVTKISPAGGSAQ